MIGSAYDRKEMALQLANRANMSDVQMREKRALYVARIPNEQATTVLGQLQRAEVDFCLNCSAEGDFCAAISFALHETDEIREIEAHIEALRKMAQA
jgi:hypothetical protein